MDLHEFTNESVHEKLHVLAGLLKWERCGPGFSARDAR
jgi:hypothetical protein